jgi:hypothetical protein
MRISKLLAVTTAGCAVAAAVALPAAAGALGASHHPAVASKTKQFPSTLTPKVVRPGQTLTLKGHGAKKNTSYSCVFVVIKGSNYTIGSIKNVKSTKKGKITCKRKFEPYTATSLSGGKSHHCPLTKKDKKAHWRCALAVSTLDKSSATIAYFTAKK